MLNRAPKVYTPVEPEDNGIVLPVILSLTVHGAILAFIVFSHNIPRIKTAPPIETSIVTPQELARMQAQISANRAAMVSVSQADPVPVPTLDNRQHQPTTPVYKPQPSQTESRISRGMSSIFGDKNATETTEINPFDDNLTEDPLDIQQEGNQAPINTQNSSSPEQTHTPADIRRVNEEFTPSAAGDPTEGKANPTSGKKTNSKSKQQVAAELDAIITPLWNAGEQHIGEKVVVTISFDKQGIVTQVTTDRNDELATLLKQAIKQVINRNAGQLPPVVGTGRDNITITFTVSKKQK